MHRRLHRWGHSLSVHSSGDNSSVSQPWSQTLTFLWEKYFFVSDYYFMRPGDKFRINIFFWTWLTSIVCMTGFSVNKILSCSAHWCKHALSILLLTCYSQNSRCMLKSSRHLSVRPHVLSWVLQKVWTNLKMMVELVMRGQSRLTCCLLFAASWSQPRRQERNFDWLILFLNVPAFSAIPYHCFDSLSLLAFAGSWIHLCRNSLNFRPSHLI